MTDFNYLELISDDVFHKFIKITHQTTGITIDADRKSMLAGRLRKRITALNLNSYDDYFNFLNTDKNEIDVFIEHITTNETYCYRTPRIWRYLIERFIPKWISENKGQTLHAWSAAASSGEEAHTLGIILQSFKDQGAQFQYQILGTDISKKMIRRCNEGSYNERSVAKFKTEQPALYSRYVRCEAEKYFVDSNIKQRITFKQHNLFHSLNYPHLFDIILLRNVLIYFTAADQERVIELIHKKLSPNGVLIIGESESLNSINTKFSLLEPLIYEDSKFKSFI